MTSLTLGPREEEQSPVPRPSPSPHPQNIQVTDLAQVQVNISWHLSVNSSVTNQLLGHLGVISVNLYNIQPIVSHFVLLYNLILFLIVQLMMDDVSSETCLIKNELQKSCVVHQSIIIIIISIKITTTTTIIIIIIIIIIINNYLPKWRWLAVDIY